MSQLLAIPNEVLGFLNSSAVRSQLNTTTWLTIGALVFYTLSLVLTERLALFVAVGIIFTTLVPTILVSAGLMPNELEKTVEKGKTAPLFPNPDGSKGTPSNRGLVVLIIGIRISHPLGLLAPGAKQTGDYFMALVEDLKEHPTERGYLGGEFVTSDESNSLSLIAYFDTMHALHEFAQGDLHRQAWNWWNKMAKDMPHLGVYHEAYDVPKHSWEAVYLQTPKMGLGNAQVTLEDGSRQSILTDARKGVWRSSPGRMGREQGHIPDSDPYKDD